MKELIERLRLIDGVCNEAADALEQQAAVIEQHRTGWEQQRMDEGRLK
jgi:hypothetical protein